ncbi:PKD domain-containing protein [Microbacterium sp. Root180]|uniref:PKD domain-containing protein n=1 Tax=Microbacterium sp. Root180 TaxID=1736483 RepID=UPI0009EC6504|nr:PKD domain-containing protein [Microbacterium sp. Root180]
MSAGAWNLRKFVVGVTVSAVVAAGAVVGIAAPASAVSTTGPAPIEQRSASTVSSDPLPTVQIDAGVVWAQVIAGDTVFAGGSFTNARPAGAGQGTNLMPRSNILAYNINTGVATSFAPVINGTVKALAVSPDGNTLYVGGSFNQVDGQTRFNVAAFNTATGALLTTFKPAIGGSYVNAIVATNSTVYFGGLIGAAGGITRKNLAAVQASNGAVLSWAPTTDLQVDAMVVNASGSKIIAAGRFETVNGTTSRGMAALDPTTGALVPWAANATIKNGLATGSLAGRAGIYSISTDTAGGVYGTAWVYSNVSVGNLEGMFALEGETGAVRWIADCHGDHYGIFSDGTNVYSTGHEHDCQTANGLPQASGNPGNMRNATAYTAAAKGTLTRSPSTGSIYSDWNGYPAPAAINWYPDWMTGVATGQGQAGWTATGNSEYLLIGGEFPLVNNIRSQGIARFSAHPAGGAKMGPVLSGVDWTPTAKSIESGSARVQFPANWDRDDLDLTYELWAQGAAQPLATSTAQAPFWNRPTQALSAGGFTPGSTQTFYVIAKDGDGNSARSADVSLTISGAAGSTYATTVLDDNASLYWRLGGSNSTGGADVAGGNNAVMSGGVGTNSDDALSGEANGSATFNGSSNGIARSSATPLGASFATELWFKTSTSSGGKLVGYGSATSGSSSNPDRHLYMRNNGALVFGVWQGSNKTIESPATYRDNQWHHAVAQLSPTAGMQLFVDGALVASDNTTTATARSLTGYWRVGGDTVSGWPSAPSSNYFNGRIDEFAVYPGTLTAAQVSEHYALGTGLALPTAAFTATGDEMAKSFDASASTAPAGRTITSYAWDFGDGTTGTGVTASHTYAAPGAYSVTLTVKDSANFTATKTTSVTAAPPHQAPVAAFTPNVAGLSTTFDASASSASGAATITGYAWTFGDGATSTEAAPTHAYAAAGTYTATLTVTDNLGATSTLVSHDVTVSHAAPVAAFTTSTAGLTVSFDAATSSASDGASLQYSWNWGDGSPAGSGVSPAHTFAANGIYPVVLTLTDSLGATATKSVNVSVASQVLAARDDFERTVATGWGAAQTGGSWNGTTGFSVSGGAGKIALNAGQTRTSTLTAVSVRDIDATATVSADKLANGGGLHFNLTAHKSTAGEYRLKVRTLSTGVVAASITKLVGTTETTLQTKNLTGFTYTDGAKLRLHWVVSTTGGTTALKANVWSDGATEPAAWFLSTSDGQAELQGAGQVGILSYLSGSTTNVPVTVSLDDLVIVDTAASATPVHADPVASFTATPSELAVTADASASSASDGATLTYAWNWGDGASSTGVSPSHTYAAAGTYTITLTLTDSLGGTATKTLSVTVSEHVHPNPVASFTASTSNLGVTVDGSGSTPSEGAALTYAWNWGDGTAAGSGAAASHTYAMAGTYTVTLNLSDAMGGSASTAQQVTVTAPPEVFIAKDDFERTVATGWGTAVTGGPWGTTTGFSVADGVGKATLNAGQTRTNLLTTVSAQDVDARLVFSSDVLANGGGLHMNYLVHKTTAGDYRLKLRIASSGVVTVSLAKVVGTTETLIINRTLSGYTHTAGGKLQLRVQAVTSGGTTALKGKVWADGTTEPTDWFVSTTDAQAELQGAGQVGILTYLSGSATNVPVTVNVDNLEVK